jgi:hypothetical protein
VIVTYVTTQLQEGALWWHFNGGSTNRAGLRRYRCRRTGSANDR